MSRTIAVMHSELVTAIDDHLRRLEQLVRMIDASAWNAATHRKNAGIRAYVDSIASHLVLADGFSSMAELKVIQALHREIVKWEDARSFVRETVDAYPDALIAVPTFLSAAVLHDSASGARVSSALAGELESLFALFALADGEVAPRERAGLNEVRTTIHGALRAVTDAG